MSQSKAEPINWHDLQGQAAKFRPLIPSLMVSQPASAPARTESNRRRPRRNKSNSSNVIDFEEKRRLNAAQAALLAKQEKLDSQNKQEQHEKTVEYETERAQKRNARITDEQREQRTIGEISIKQLIELFVLNRIKLCNPKNIEIKTDPATAPDKMEFIRAAIIVARHIDELATVSRQSESILEIPVDDKTLRLTVPSGSYGDPDAIIMKKLYKIYNAFPTVPPGVDRARKAGYPFTLL